MQLDLHLGVFFLHFAELLSQQQVSLPFILIGLVDDLLQDHDLPLQVEDLVAESLFGGLLAGMAQHIGQYPDYFMTVPYFIAQADDCLLVELGKRLRLFEFNPQFAIFLDQVVVI